METSAEQILNNIEFYYENIYNLMVGFQNANDKQKWLCPFAASWQPKPADWSDRYWKPWGRWRRPDNACRSHPTNRRPQLDPIVAVVRWSGKTGGSQTSASAGFPLWSSIL